MSDFAWDCSVGTSPDFTPSVYRTQMGDGYITAAQNGVGALPTKWNYVHDDVDAAEALAVYNFLKSKGGYQRFTWTPPPPFNTEIYVRCAKFSMPATNPMTNRITAEFEVAYAP